jgi:hypothetical protein
MADPLRHRQTKGAATDMVDLTPPRHIPTLPKAVACFPQSVRQDRPIVNLTISFCRVGSRDLDSAAQAF